MKRLYLILSMPLCLVAASCGSDNSGEPSQSEKDGGFNISMALVQTKASEDEAVLSHVDEWGFDLNKIHFGSYSTTGELKHFLYSAGKKNEEVKADFYWANWGHTVSAFLPKSECEMGFSMAFFSTPDGFRVNDKFELDDLMNEEFRLLKWPAQSASNVWPEVDGDKKFNLPMAGLRKVSREYMQGYNKNVYTGVSPFRLENIEPLRAMAKVVIADPYEVIGSVTLKTPDKGYISPDGDKWLAGGIVPPAVPSEMTLLDQTLDSPNSTIKDEDGNLIPAFVFYTFEQDFRNEKGDAECRKIISVTASSLTDIHGAPLKTTLSIAPYVDGFPDGDTPVGKLMTDDNGAWQGVMRNRMYIYRLGAPRDMGLDISVRVLNWEHERIPTEL